MPEYDAALGEPLRPGGPDVVLAERFDQGTTGEPGVDRRRHGGERDPGQNHVPHPPGDALRRGYVAVLYPGEAVLVQRQEHVPQQQLAEDERRHRQAGEHAEGRHPVEQAAGPRRVKIPTPGPPISQSTTPR